MASTANPGSVGIQATTYSVPQGNRSSNSCGNWCSHFCSILLVIFSVIVVFLGAMFIIIASSGLRSMTSYDVYEPNPALDQGKNNMKIIGITLLVVGVLMMVCGVFLCRYVRKNRAVLPPFTYTTMTSNVPISNYTSSTTGFVQPPAPQPMDGGAGPTMYTCSHQPNQAQAGNRNGPGTVRQAQQCVQYPPTHAAGQYRHAQPVVKPSAPSDDTPNPPPPSYNELYTSSQV